MIWRLLVALAFYLFICTSFGFAQTDFFPKELLTPDFIRNLTWKTDPRLAQIVNKWPAYIGEQGFEDRIVLNQTETRIMGVKFRVEYRELKANSMGEILLLSGVKDDHGKDFCTSFIEWGVKHYGKPHKVIDLSTVPNKEGGFFENLWADWEIGQTRIKLACSGAAIYGSYIPGIALVSYRQKAQEKALEELIYIECSRTSKDFGPLFKVERPIQQQPPFILIINPNDRDLRRQDKSVFLKTNKFTDAEILASEENEKGTHEMRIDRTTGNYEWKIRIRARGQIFCCELFAFVGTLPHMSFPDEMLLPDRLRRHDEEYQQKTPFVFFGSVPVAESFVSLLRAARDKKLAIANRLATGREQRQAPAGGFLRTKEIARSNR